MSTPLPLSKAGHLMLLEFVVSSSIIKLASPPRDPNTQEFASEFDCSTASGHFILSAVSWDIIVPRNSNDRYVISPCHLVQVFPTFVDCPRVHHIRAQSLESRLDIGDYGDVFIMDVRIPNNLNLKMYYQQFLLNDTAVIR